MISGVTRLGGLPGLPGTVTLSAGSSRNLTPRNTTRDAFMKKYTRVQELTFRLSHEVSLERLYSNSLIASATTTSRNLTPAPRGY